MVANVNEALEALRSHNGDCSAMVLRWLSLPGQVRSHILVTDYLGGNCPAVLAGRLQPQKGPFEGRSLDVRAEMWVPKAFSPVSSGHKLHVAEEDFGMIQRRPDELLLRLHVVAANDVDRARLTAVMTERYRTYADVTKAIKAILKHHMPDLKWSVRKGRGTAGSWMHIDGVVKQGPILNGHVSIFKERLGVQPRTSTRAGAKGQVSWTGKTWKLHIKPEDYPRADNAVGTSSPLGRLLASEKAPSGVKLTGDELVVLDLTGRMKASYRRGEAFRWGIDQARYDAAVESLQGKGLLKGNRAISGLGRNELEHQLEEFDLRSFNPPWRDRHGNPIGLGGQGPSEATLKNMRLLRAGQTPTFSARFAESPDAPPAAGAGHHLTLALRNDRDGLWIEGDTFPVKAEIKAWRPFFEGTGNPIGFGWKWEGRRKRWVRPNTNTIYRHVSKAQMLEWGRELAQATGASVTVKRQNEQFSYLDELGVIKPTDAPAPEAPSPADNALEVMKAQMAMFDAMVTFEAMVGGAS